jgi:alkylation response protein AidB-like acyl-CoA dehydrogenase
VALDDCVLEGVKEYVLDGQVADVAIVAARSDGELALFAAGVSTARCTPHPTLDLTRRQARLEFTGSPAVRVSPVGDRGAAAARALDLARVALAVESVGVGAASLAMTVEYLKIREQFGVPLATFQALRHRVADLAVRLEAATSSAWYALRVAGTEEFAVAAPLAKLVATQAAWQITAQSIQLHGGIGFTWEHDAQLYFKRAVASRFLFGDPASLRRCVGARAGLWPATVAGPGQSGAGLAAPE